MISNYNLPEKIFSKLCNRNMQAPGSSENCSHPEKNKIAHQSREWDKYWSRFGISIPDFSGKIVVDYGCGFGFDSLFALQQGAAHVYCLEIADRRLELSRQLHLSNGYTNASYINNTHVKELHKAIPAETVDIIFSRDVMEHVPSPYEVLQSMHFILKPGGDTYIGFSPLYKSPYGPHFGKKCKYPWVHLVFSEKTILNVFKRLYGLSETINSYQEIEGSGVNKLSYYDYQRMIDSFGWDKQIDLANSFPDRLAMMRALNILVRTIPAKSLKELVLVNSYIQLKKCNQSHTSNL